MWLVFSETQYVVLGVIFTISFSLFNLLFKKTFSVKRLLMNNYPIFVIHYKAIGTINIPTAPNTIPIAAPMATSFIK